MGEPTYSAYVSRDKKRVVLNSRTWDGVDQPEHVAVMSVGWKTAFRIADEIRAAAEDVRQAEHADKIALLATKRQAHANAQRELNALEKEIEQMAKEVEPSHPSNAATAPYDGRPTVSGNPVITDPVEEKS